MSFTIALLLIAQAAVGDPGGAASPAKPAVSAKSSAPDAAEQGPTQAEMDTEVKDFFLKLDTNRDGHVDRAEAEAGHRAAVVAGQAAAFARLDTNHDGMLSKDEFSTAAVRAPMNDFWFDSNDIDRDGRVELNEALARGQRNFERMDSNNDGRISEEELLSVRQRGRRR